MNTLTILSDSQAEAGAESPGRVIPAFAHELRNPLANINLAVEIIESSFLDENLKVYLDIIMRSSARIKELISEQTENTHPAKGKNGKQSLQKLLDEVLDMAKDKITLKNIFVTRDYEESDYKIDLDAEKMKVALTNIVINAIDAMNFKNGHLKLTTCSTAENYIVRIQDNGSGISKENIGNIFKDHFTTKPEGLGIGLLTVQDFLIFNKVKVDIESEEGVGTSFTLSFDKNK